MTIRDRFSSENPYVLSQQLITARSRVKTDLNVILTENDQVKATNAYLQTQALTNSPANPVSAVTSVGQQTIGAALGGGDITGGGGFCFVSTTCILTPHGIKYICDVIPKDIVCTFDPVTGEMSEGMVTDKAIHLSPAYMMVTFDDGHSTGVDADGVHRYWMGDNEYRSIKSQDRVFHHQKGWMTVESRRIVLEECLLYNITVSPTHNYIANGHYVSNAKPPPDIPGGGGDLPFE